MGSLVKLFDSSKAVSLQRICSAIFPQLNRNLAGSNSPHKKKRPPSPFASFFREKQASLKEQHPDLKQVDLMKLASTLWSNESFDTKQLFKNEYERKIEEYKEELKKPPKRPLPPFMQFAQDNNHSLEMKHFNLIERARKAGAMWNMLSVQEKERYKENYTEKMKEFHENLSEEEKQLLNQRRMFLSEQRTKRDIRRFGKQALRERPKSPVNNPFSIYVKMHSSEVPHKQNVFKYLGERWRSLDDGEKQLYKDKLQDVTEQYKKDIAVWQRKHDKRAK